MSFYVFTLIIGPIVGIAFYALIISCVIKRKRKAKEEAVQTAEPVRSAEPVLDDVSYIQEMKHQSLKVGSSLWQQYDFLLAARPYGWDYMVGWADYMETADFDNIDSMTVSAPGEKDIELARIYNQNKVGVKNFDRLAKEMASLSIAGHSRTLNNGVKIVWFNQTRVLRVFTRINDETLITKYVETIIRRSFGTPDAMKFAKPIPKE